MEPSAFYEYNGNKMEVNQVTPGSLMSAIRMMHIMYILTEWEGQTGKYLPIY